MGKLYKIAAIATVFSFLTACGGTDAVSNGTGSPASNQRAANNSTNQTTPAETTAGLPPPAENQPVDPQALAEKKSLNRPPLGSEETNVNSNVQVLTIDPKQLPAKAPTKTLSDGSEISTFLGEKGAVETRTFKNNPQLAKLERTTTGNVVAIKAYLKNGKVVAIDKNKIQNFTNDSPEQILRAAGIEPLPPPPGTAPKEKTYTFTFPVKPAN